MTNIQGRTLQVGACLSLSGRFARFGVQAAHALEAWKHLHGSAEVHIEDDQSDPAVLARIMPDVARTTDIVLGPYSTLLMRTAGRIVADEGLLLWNHGGSGDDVEAAHPGHVISVLTPTSRYAEPFVKRLAEHYPGPLWIARGKGRFGRQVADGAETIARHLSIETARIEPGDQLPSIGTEPWNLFSVGQFEDDVHLVKHALTLPYPPQAIGCVAAGVHAFADAVGTPEGIFGVGQWAPSTGQQIELGPTEDDFTTAFTARTGCHPDYPAVQAAAAAVLATHCVQRANSIRRDRLWTVATDLDTRTLFGGFRIDPSTGAQVKHTMVLMRWDADRNLAPI